MKYATILKIAFLAIPAILMMYVLWFRKGISGGGGSYDLTKFYTVAGVGIWAALFVIITLMSKARGQVGFLLAGGFLFGFSMMMLAKML